MKKDIIKSSDRSIKHRGSLTVCEYPSFNKDIDVIYAELNGRFPEKGYITNYDSDEIYLIHEGSGEIYMDGRIIKFKNGDIVPIIKGTKYCCKGDNLKFFSIITPPWNKEAEKKVE